MQLAERVNVLIRLGEHMQSLDGEEFQTLFLKAEADNPWFTLENIKRSLSAIRDQYLSVQALHNIINKYHLDDNIGRKKIGLILAGNIPLVGVHDVICCFLCGHTALIKVSDKDKILMQWFIHEMVNLEPRAAQYLFEVEKLKDYDAAIATGSNASAVHFEYYFSHVPHIIRRNRNSIAVLTGHETADQLVLLGSDIFSYFGLGCRNVSMVLVPEGYDIKVLIDALEPFKAIMHHNKYKNNYDYNLALMLLNNETFLQSDFVIWKESDQIISRIASIHYRFYKNKEELVKWLKSKKDEIQCVVSNQKLPETETVPFGMAQCPDIDVFADGVDTMEFLLSV